MKNTNDAPTSDQIRNDNAIPFASQIPNDSGFAGENLGEVLASVGERQRVVVEDLDIVTLNDEQTVALGGLSTNQFCPTTAILQVTGVGGTVAGDGEITIGITTGGTEILAATVSTGTLLNDKLVVDLSAVKKAAMPGNSTIYAKVTKADTTGTAGTLLNVWLMGEIIPTA